MVIKSHRVTASYDDFAISHKVNGQTRLWRFITLHEFHYGSFQDNSYFIIHNSKVYGLHPISMMDQYFDGKRDLFSYSVVKSHTFQLFFEKSDRRRVKTFLKGHFINLLSVPVNKKNADNSALLWNRDLNSNYTRIYTNMFVLCHSLSFLNWDADNKVWKF